MTSQMTSDDERQENILVALQISLPRKEKEILQKYAYSKFMTVTSYLRYHILQISKEVKD